MNAIKNIYAVLALIALCLSSCEMKNELEGKYNLKNDEGLLTLDLVNKTQATPTTKAESTSLTDELDVNTYKVEIVDNATEAVVRSFASYAKLKEALPLVVPVGNYKIVAKSGVLQDASRTPYFEGSSSIEVKQGMESKAEVLCKSATVKVSLNISEEFLNMFADDYVFTVSNGIGGVIYVKKEDLSSIYLSIPDGSTSIKIVAKVTEKDSGRDIETVYTVTKPDAEGLQGGDSFNVTVKPVEEGEDPNNPDVTPSDPKLGIQLDIDLTMDETGITVKVPTELIEESKPDEPDQPTDPDQPTVDGPEIIGADEVVEVDTISVLGENDIILDIRSPEETDENPFESDAHQVMQLPFYKLSSQFGSLDQSKNYVLYCERGVMSKLQALYLKENGFTNVRVFGKK